MSETNVQINSGFYYHFITKKLTLMNIHNLPLDQIFVVIINHFSNKLD